MEAKDVLELPWKKLKDWSDLSASYKDRWGVFYVCETDVDVFVENVYRDISRQLKISYTQLEPVLQKENEAFGTLKRRLFKNDNVYGKEAARLLSLEKILRVPDIVAKNKVTTCFRLFEELSDIEKVAFLEKIGKVNVQISYSAAEETMVE